MLLSLLVFMINMEPAAYAGGCPTLCKGGTSSGGGGAGGVAGGNGSSDNGNPGGEGQGEDGKDIPGAGCTNSECPPDSCGEGDDPVDPDGTFGEDQLDPNDPDYPGGGGGGSDGDPNTMDDLPKGCSKLAAWRQLRKYKKKGGKVAYASDLRQFYSSTGVVIKTLLDGRLASRLGGFRDRDKSSVTHLFGKRYGDFVGKANFYQNPDRWILYPCPGVVGRASTQTRDYNYYEEHFTEEDLNTYRMLDRVEDDYKMDSVQASLGGASINTDWDWIYVSSDSYHYESGTLSDSPIIVINTHIYEFTLDEVTVNDPGKPEEPDLGISSDDDTIAIGYTAADLAGRSYSTHAFTTSNSSGGREGTTSGYSVHSWSGMLSNQVNNTLIARVYIKRGTIPLNSDYDKVTAVIRGNEALALAAAGVDVYDEENSDFTFEDHADLVIAYDDEGRVDTLSRGCPSCGASDSATSVYEYSDYPGRDLNHWVRKQTIYRRDSSTHVGEQVIIYTNHIGREIHRVTELYTGSGPTPAMITHHRTELDIAGRVVREVTPDAVSATFTLDDNYSSNDGELNPISVKSSDGLIREYVYDLSDFTQTGDSGLDENSTPDGLVGSYYDNDSLTGTPVYQQVDANLYRIWGEESPIDGDSVNTDYSVKWKGKIYIKDAGDYVFYVDTDTNAKITIDGISPGSWGRGEWSYPASGSVGFTQDQIVDIEVEYRHDAAEAEGGISLEWERSVSGVVQDVRSSIPANQLYSGISANGPVISKRIRQGEGGSLIETARYEYYSPFAWNLDQPHTGTTITRQNLAKKITRYVYDQDPDPGQAETDDPQVTEYSYPDGFHDKKLGGETMISGRWPKTKVTTVTLSAAEVLVTREHHYDGGQLMFRQDPDGRITYYQYVLDNNDLFLGDRVRFVIRDLNTTSPPTNTGLSIPALPSDFTDTTTGLNLITENVYHANTGKRTEAISPDGTTTRILVIRHDDTYAPFSEATETRTYSNIYNDGSTWKTGTPVRVTFADDGGRINTEYQATVTAWGGTAGAPSASDTLKYVARTDYIYDELSRRMETRRYDTLDANGAIIESGTTPYILTETVYGDLGRIDKTTDTAGKSSYYTQGIVAASQFVYGDSSYLRESRIYPHSKAAGPIRVNLSDATGRTIRTYEATTTASDWVGSATGPIGSETLTPISRRTYGYDWRNRSAWNRSYFDLSGLAENAEGTEEDGNPATADNYYQTTYLAYDNQGKQLRAKDSLGNISATVYDRVGRTISSWLGTTDTDATLADPSASGTNNMKMVSETTYGNGDSGPGTRMVSRTRLKPTSTIEYTTDTFEYDTAGRLVWAKPGDFHSPWVMSTLDAAGRTEATEVYLNGTTSGDSNILAKSASEYDNAGRIIASKTFDIEPSGPTTNYLLTTYTYDDLGHQIKTAQTGGAFTKIEYDALGRIARSVSGSDEGESPPAPVGANGLIDYSSDTVLTETVFTYDDIGNIVKTTNYERLHDASVTGLLSSSGSARISYIASWFDDAHRTTHTAFYGTNISGASPPVNPPANDTPSVIVTEVTYNDAGKMDTVTDNKNIMTKAFYDALGRMTHAVENYDNFTPANETTAGGTGSKTDRVTKYVYNGASQVIQQIALAPNGDGTLADNQTTEYAYGGDATGESPIKRKDLLITITYPDSTSASDTINMTYYANGSLATRTDQREVELTYLYGEDGQRIRQTVTAGTVVGDKRIDYYYTNLRQLFRVVSASDTSGTSITSEVQYKYNGFGQPEIEYQQHGDDVDTNSSPKILYGYNDTVASNVFTNATRQTTTTYPNGREVHRIYDGHNGIDDAISRVNAIAEDAVGTNKIVEYSYLGSGRMVRKDYPKPNVRLDYIDESDEGTVDDPYELSLDRFGRVIRHQWEDYDEYDEGGTERFNILHAYDNVGNRTYADRQVYKSHSQFYIYDHLHRLEDYQAGKMSYNESVPDGIEDYWTLNGRGYSLDQLGNQLAVTTPEATDYYKHEIDDGGANEYTSREVRSDVVTDAFNDTFTSDTIASGQWEKVGSDTDTYSIDTGAGTLTITDAVDDGDDDPEDCAVLLKGEAVGPFNTRFYLKFPTDTTAGQAGLVFGYTSPGNYWLYVADIATNQVKLFQVVDGVKQTVQAVQNVGTIADGTTKGYYMAPKRFTANTVWNTDFEFTNGFPSGKFGLWTNTDNVVFESVVFRRDAPTVELAGRWLNTGFARIYDTGGGEGRLRIQATNPSTSAPLLLDGVRAQRFEATFKMYRISSSDFAKGYFILGASDTDDFIAIKLFHADTNSPQALAPVVYEVNDGHNFTLISPDTSDAGNVPARGDTQELWVRVTSDGDKLSVRYSANGTFTDYADCYTTTNADLTRPGAMVGFMASSYTVEFDNFTLKADRNGSVGDVGGDNYEVTECVDTFDIDSGYVVQNLAYDPAGNLIYDGRHEFTYDAWNRLIEVINAYPDGAGSYYTGSIVGAMSYDAMGRRTVKAIRNSANLDTTNHYYYDGQSVVQIDNGHLDDVTDELDGQMLKQFVWGLQYIDELCQIGLNLDPTNAHTAQYAENIAERFYYTLQDANYNVLGVITVGGKLIERYEYTPYGQRTVYSHGDMRADINGNGLIDIGDRSKVFAFWDQSSEAAQVADMNGDGIIGLSDMNAISGSYWDQSAPANDPLVSYPTFHSSRALKKTLYADLTTAPLCEVGHQGLFHDEEFGSQGGLIHNRARTLHPRLGRFMQRDPLGYVDGMSLYEYVGSNPLSYLDPKGATVKWEWTTYEGDYLHETGSKEVKNWTQRFLGIVTPARAIVTWDVSSEASNSKVKGVSIGKFKHFNSLIRVIALGWSRYEVRDAFTVAFVCDKGTGKIRRKGGPDAVGNIVTSDGPLSTAIGYGYSIDNTGDTDHTVTVDVTAVVNVGGTVTKTIGLKGGVKGGKGIVEGGVEVGETTTMSWSGGSTQGPWKTTYVLKCICNLE